MTVEDHPNFAKREAASKKLAEAKLAQERGEGSKVDVSMALMELNAVRDEIDNA